MSKTYTFSEVSEILHLSPATIYKWESHMPHLKPNNAEGGRKYDTWEFELLKLTKRFFFTYNQDIERTQIAVERWMSRNPRSQHEDDDVLDYLNKQNDMRSTTGKRASRSIGKSEVILSNLLDEDNDVVLPSEPPQPQPLVLSTHDTQETHKEIEALSKPDPRAMNHDVGFNHHKKASHVTHNETMNKQHVPNQSSFYGQNTYGNHGEYPSYTQALNSNDMHRFIDVAGDHSEVQTWKRAFNEAQSKLTQTKAELARSQDHLRQQHAAIKQLQADFNALKELIRKEIYDLRDLVVDKE